MEFVNAIAKARFSSAKPQRVQLHAGKTMQAELLCLEHGQEIRVAGGEWFYYVLAGQATFSTGGRSSELPAGQLAFFVDGQEHAIANAGEQRLLCLAVGH